jgi:nucleotide-binding universal stress UspA family protein
VATHRSAQVLVGVDGADHTRQAIAWAAVEAVLRDVSLRLVHAYIWPIVASLAPPDGLREQARDVLAESAELARAAAPGVRVESDMQTDYPENLLARESRDASYLVVGSRGLGPAARLLAGSVTTRLVVRAACPLAVVREDPPAPDGPVVVGVDGSGYSAAALGTAMELADSHGARLHVVHVTRGRDSDPTVDVDRMVGRWRPAFPDTFAQPFVLEGRADKVLLELADAASAVVVGARGQSPLSSVLFGSVSRSLVVRARCPVVVIPAGVREPTPVGPPYPLGGRAPARPR